MINHYLNGEISLDENDLSRMNYIITCPIDGTQNSITDILDTIYNSKNTIKKLIRVAGRVYNSNETFHGFESLHISKDKYKTYSYYVGSFAFENTLYNLIGSKVEIVIEDYNNSTGTSEDMHNDTTSKAM